MIDPARYMDSQRGIPSIKTFTHIHARVILPLCLLFEDLAQTRMCKLRQIKTREKKIGLKDEGGREGRRGGEGEKAD